MLPFSYVSLLRRHI